MFSTFKEGKVSYYFLTIIEDSNIGENKSSYDLYMLSSKKENSLNEGKLDAKFYRDSGNRE